jgi:hypothetical protein
MKNLRQEEIRKVCVYCCCSTNEKGDQLGWCSAFLVYNFFKNYFLTYYNVKVFLYFVILFNSPYLHILVLLLHRNRILQVLYNTPTNERLDLFI